MQFPGDIMTKCPVFCVDNPKIQRNPPVEEVKRGIALGEYWHIVTELPKTL